jgi:hypothetical protein
MSSTATAGFERCGEKFPRRLVLAIYLNTLIAICKLVFLGTVIACTERMSKSMWLFDLCMAVNRIEK